MEAGSEPATAKRCQSQHERSERMGFERSQAFDWNCWLSPFNRRSGFASFNRNRRFPTVDWKRWFAAFDRKCGFASLDWNRWFPSFGGKYFHSNFSFKEHKFVWQSLIFR